MNEQLAVWYTLFLLGAYHGVNPEMGWLFAVARSIQEHGTRAVAWSLPPIALGHALSIGAVVLIAGLAQVALPLTYIRNGMAVTLVGLGAYKLIRSRHFRWGGMQVGFRELTIWSFLMASAHGAGLMVLPVVVAHRPKGGFVSWLHPFRFLNVCNPSYGDSDFFPGGTASH
jgi:hypothetical protein